MSYKLLLPTFRNRYLFVEHSLEARCADAPCPGALNVGGGEGDFDPPLAEWCAHVVSCDINAEDVEFARRAGSCRHAIGKGAVLVARPASS